MGPDRSLLQAAFAARFGLVGREPLLQALRAWLETPDRAFVERLQAVGGLTDADVRLLEDLAAELFEEGSSADSESTIGSQLLDKLHKEIERFDPSNPASAPPEPAQASTVGPSPSSTEEQAASFEIAPELLPEDEGDPRSLGRYRLTTLHAEGGIGQIWKAKDLELDRRVAVKLLRPERANVGRLQEALIQEARITSRIAHPGTIPILGAGARKDRGPFYAMQFVEGPSLSQAVRSFHRDRKAEAARKPDWHRDLAFRDLLNRLIDVCQVMALAHERGVIHRDLKPSNVLLGLHGETFVADWGLAAERGSEARDAAAARPGEGLDVPRSPDEPPPRREGSYIGTPQYMSPEAATGDPRAIGPASDIYGLGALLFFIATGRPPINGPDLGACVSQLLRGRSAEPYEIDPTLPRSLSAICGKAMSRDPQRRYAQAQELEADLQRWLAGETVSAHADPVWVRFGRWADRHQAAVAGFAVLILSTTVLLAISNVVIGHWRHQAEAERDRVFRQSIELSEALDRAEKHRNDGIALVEAIVEQNNARLIGPEIPATHRIEMLRLGLEHAERTLRHQPEDAASLLRVARMARQLGHVQRLIGNDREAERLYRLALERVEEAREQDPTLVRTQDFVMPRLDLATTLRRDSRVSEGLEHLDKIAEEAGETLDLLPDLFRAVLDAERAQYLMDSGSLHGALAEIRDAAAVLRDMLPSAIKTLEQGDLRTERATPALQVGLLAMLADSAEADALERLGRSEEARRRLERAMELYQRFQAALQGQHCPNLELIGMNLTVRCAVDRLDEPASRPEALRQLDAAVETLASLSRAQPELVGRLDALANAWRARAKARRLTDDREGALEDLNQAIDAWQRLHERNPDHHESAARLAEARTDRARLLWEERTSFGADRLETARDDLRRADALWDRLLDRLPDHPGYREAQAETARLRERIRAAIKPGDAR